ncbi:probable serine/threonine-protein kinase DDB_G0271682 [Actinia tenebrosa]|uniref:Probable serine/threonine-protein kinase DDB_G0271682 n=1 Tax=Actinia tenebrosa TaxID=6105 RepID=A0A6P8IXI0_ACTTE|nr:probable serine/threonine-protein kinase DDB_G0271682 [Actinia tenebrosa]
MSVKKLVPLDISYEPSIEYVEMLGEGSYGEVWSAIWNGRSVAAKRILEKYFKRDYGQEIRDHYVGELKKEWEILRDLVHPNIVRMHEVLFPLNKSPVIIMELLHCDLLHYIEKSTSTPKVSPSKGLSIALGVAEGLEYLHGRNPPVVHRDLATKNILLTVDGQPKIADLGVAKVFTAGKDDFATAKPGTPLYAAPETYPTQTKWFGTMAKYGVKVDIFSFGVVLLVIIIGHEPVVFPVSPIKDGYKIPEVKRRENDIQAMGEHELKGLVLDCLKDKSSSRPHASTLVTELKRIRNDNEVKRCSSVLSQPKNTTVNLSRTDSFVPFEKIPSQPHYHYKFKVLFLGNSNTGKTCLHELLKNPAYDITNTVLTIGISPIRQWFQYDSSYVRMEVTDTAGQERHFSLPPSYVRDVDGVFLVYDVSKKYTFENIRFWIDMIDRYKSKDKEKVQILLVGNKVDLRQNVKPEDLVPEERALEYAGNIQCPYVETSAKDIDSVMAMYKKMVEALISTVSPEDIAFEEREAGSMIRLPSPPNKSRTWKNYICPFCKSS